MYSSDPIPLHFLLPDITSGAVCPDVRPALWQTEQNIQWSCRYGIFTGYIALKMILKVLPKSLFETAQYTDVYCFYCTLYWVYILYTNVLVELAQCLYSTNNTNVWIYQDLYNKIYLQHLFI